MDVSDEARRRQIEHSKTWGITQQFLDDQSRFNGLAKPDLVSDQHTPEVRLVEAVPNEARLMSQGHHRVPVEASLAVFEDQEPCLKPSKTPPSHGLERFGRNLL
jgi:hypothetical protein